MKSISRANGTRTRVPALRELMHFPRVRIAVAALLQDFGTVHGPRSGSRSTETFEGRAEPYPKKLFP